MTTIPKRCDLCGKFRKLTELNGMAGENDEEWVECDWCMSGVDYERKFGLIVVNTVRWRSNDMSLDVSLKDPTATYDTEYLYV